MNYIESKPRIAIIKFPGTNCEKETRKGFEMAGGRPEIIPVSEFETGNKYLPDYQALALAGGFSYGDHLGSGRVAAIVLDTKLGNQVARFKEKGSPSIGICNGFQIMVQSEQFFGKSGIQLKSVTLDRNDNGQFDSDRIRLSINPNSRCVFLKDLENYGPVEFQIAHAEGKAVTASDAALDRLEEQRQVVFRYLGPNGESTELYPYNPNGSSHAIAGITNETGTDLGLMPHPERSIKRIQYPNWRRMPQDFVPEGLQIFEGMVEYASQI